MAGGNDEFERRKMEALGFIYSGGGWVTTGTDTGGTMTVWPYQGNNNYTTTDGYGSGYVTVPGHPPSLGSNVPGEKSLAQIQLEKAYFEQVAAVAEKRLSTNRTRMQNLTAEVNALSGGDRLRKQTALAVESVEEITLEAELDGARANAIHADLSMQGMLGAGGLPHYTAAQNSEKRQERDKLRNGIVVKNQEKQCRIAELNRLNAELSALDAGQDIREITATRELEDTGNRVNALSQEQQRLMADISRKNTLSAEAHARAEDFKQRREKIQFVYDEMKQRDYEAEMNRLYRENQDRADQLTAQASSSQGTLNDLSSQLDIARNQQAEKQKQLEAVRTQVAVEKTEAEKRLAETRWQEETARQAREEKERLARKAEEQNRAREALWQKAGITPAPLYSPEMITAAEASMGGAGVMALGNTAGSMQLSVSTGGVWTAVGELTSSLAAMVGRGVAVLGGAATASTVGPVVAAASTILFSTSAGQGSDKVPGRDLEALFALNARLLAGQDIKIEPGVTSVNLPVRGRLVKSNGQLVLQLLKAGKNLPAAVPVLNAVRDATTGLDKITVPPLEGVPGRTILVNPVPIGPAAPSHTGNQELAPMTPVHTGTKAKPVDPIAVITTPAADTVSLQDFIYWRPDAAGTGVEPVYVMLSGPYGEINAKGKYSGRDYNTDKAGGPIQNLDWKAATIDRTGVDKVKLHTGRFESTPENVVMINRLEKILKGELQATDTDNRFYTHEIRELERYRNLGIKDGEVPQSVLEQKAVWNNAHTATLEDYKINEKEQSLYTDEALQAAYEQELKDALGGKK